ncbi:hypothetical protein LSM04_001376 [Trypanosoma melophagium]|uniref:uncharacterized protein n=1 Tax=Trypanosoma melophagium TaxID=715481 RepID=UPI00351A52BE|nr:hypothetical protein LSM04_001376 [Trypanosoma melophagium]
MKTILKGTYGGIRGLFLLALLLLLYCTVGTLAVMEHHRCIFDMVSQNFPEGTPIPNTLQPESAAAKPPPRSNPDGTWAPIRIKFFGKEINFGGRSCRYAGTTIENYFGTEFVCEEEDILTPEKENILIDKIIPEAVKLHSERLLVQRLKDPIRVPTFSQNSICHKLNVPEDHKTSGVPEADMVLYVVAVRTMRQTFSWAATCARLGPEGRPVVGIINYSPRYIAATPQRIRVAAHEIAHALGFSTEEMVIKRMVKTGVTVRERTNITLVISGNTRREAMKHYNCESMVGMELEDESPFPMMRTPGASSNPRNRRPSGPRRTGLGRPTMRGRPSSLLSSETQETSVQEADIKPKKQGNVTAASYAHHVDGTQPSDKNRTIPRSHSLLAVVTANAEGASSGAIVEKKRRPPAQSMSLQCQLVG